MEKIIIAQLIAHLVADFFAQPESMSHKKRENVLSSWHLYIHVLIVFATSILLTFTIEFVIYAIAITVIHFAIDTVKGFIERRFKPSHYLFFTDQLLHVIAIFSIVVIYWKNTPVTPSYLEFFTVKQLLIITGFLLCMKPANVTIKVCLSSLHLYEQTVNDTEIQRAGRWIGTTERILAFTLVLLNQYTAIGFIIAAKSILRYNEKNTGKTEYVLIGTLLSFSIALFLGIAISQGLFEFN